MKPEDLQKPLSDKDFPTKLGKQTIDKQLINLPANGDKLLFTFGVEASAELSLYNDNNDFDSSNPDEVLGGAGSIIQFDPTAAWLKYSTQVGIKTESGLSVEHIGFNFGGKSSIRSSIYRKHAREEFLGAALLSDALTFKSIFSAAQVKTLMPREAVTFSLAGELDASVKVTWSDIFSTNLSTLSQLLQKNELFKINLGAEATVGFSVKVKDSFDVKIIGKSDNLFGIYITKSKSNSKAGTLGLTIGAEFENKQDIQKVLSNLVEGFFNQTEQCIEGIIAKVEATLTDADKIIVSQIAARLGWQNDASAFPKLKQEYDSIKANLNAKIKELAELKVAAGFTYDYVRMHTQSVLLQAETNGVGIDRFHQDILKLNISSLVTSIQKNEGIFSKATLLQKDIVHITKASGFSIGFGTWKAATNKKETIEETKIENEQGNKKISYDGKRSYSDFAGAEGTAWKIDLNASMLNFSQNQVPYANEFDYGLYLNLSWTEMAVTLEKMARFTDLAAVWGILPESHVDSVASEIFSATKGFKNFTYTCEVKINAEALDSMLPALVAGCKNDAFFSSALGKSMPRWSNYLIRKDISQRTQYYGQLWRAYLNDKDDPEPNTQLYADAACRVLEMYDKDLANAELNYNAEVFQPDSFGAIINTNPCTYLNGQALASGFEKLARGKDSGSTLAYHMVIPKAFDNVEDFWRQKFHFRTLGTLMTMVADEYPLLQQHIERTATITYENSEGKKMVQILGKS